MSPWHGSKAFIAELSRKSPSISELNESFRNLAGHLQSIFSLYETLETSVAGKHTVFVVIVCECPQRFVLTRAR